MGGCGGGGEVQAIRTPPPLLKRFCKPFLRLDPLPPPPPLFEEIATGLKIYTNGLLAVGIEDVFPLKKKSSWIRPSLRGCMYVLCLGYGGHLERQLHALAVQNGCHNHIWQE